MKLEFDRSSERTSPWKEVIVGLKMIAVPSPMRMYVKNTNQCETWVALLIFSGSCIASCMVNVNGTKPYPTNTKQIEIMKKGNRNSMCTRLLTSNNTKPVTDCSWCCRPHISFCNVRHTKPVQSILNYTITPKWYKYSDKNKNSHRRYTRYNLKIWNGC